jgi:hypothetical protein
MRRPRLMRTMTEREQAEYRELIEKHGGSKLTGEQIEYLGHCVKVKRAPDVARLQAFRT